MDTVADKLREARALVERGWCQKRAAVDASGLATGYGRATSFCMFGALQAVRLSGRKFDDAFNAIKTVVGDNPISWNDAPKRTQSEVVAAFDRAIELAEAGQ